MHKNLVKLIWVFHFIIYNKSRVKMREDESNLFTKWQEQLPSPDELMPLSQTLITPHLAIAFHINSTTTTTTTSTIPPPQAQNSPPPLPPFQSPNSGEFDSSAGDEPARTLKRPRLVWTPQLHKRFVDAVAHLGIKNAVPKTIMHLMSVDGLTRENVASHLQKYRLYLKRMQQGNLSAHGDTATDHLFATSPVPPHFLHQGRQNSEHFVPFVAVPVLHQQMAAQYRPHFGSPPNDHPFLARQAPHRMATPVHNSLTCSYNSVTAEARKVLTLFPTGSD